MDSSKRSRRGHGYRARLIFKYFSQEHKNFDYKFPSLFLSFFFPNAIYFDKPKEIFNLLKFYYETDKKIYKKIRNVRKKFKRVYHENLLNFKYFNSRKWGSYSEKYKYLGYTFDEANYLIEHLRKACIATKEKFIRRYGEEEGLKKWNEFRNK